MSSAWVSCSKNEASHKLHTRQRWRRSDGLVLQRSRWRRESANVQRKLLSRQQSHSGNDAWRSRVRALVVAARLHACWCRAPNSLTIIQMVTTEVVSIGAARLRSQHRPSVATSVCGADGRSAALTVYTLLSAWLTTISTAWTGPTRISTTRSGASPLIESAAAHSFAMMRLHRWRRHLRAMTPVGARVAAGKCPTFSITR